MSANDNSYLEVGTLHHQFCQQAAKTPDLIAVSNGNGLELTYKELDLLTSKLAAHLRLQGLDADKCCIIFMERCVEYVVAYLAILKAGGAYLPMDLSYPANLIDSVLSDSEPQAILTKPEFTERLPESAKELLWLFNEGWRQELADIKIDTDSIPAEIDIDSLAFIVYSSGTTGKPKGIAMPHRGAVFSYHWRHQNYPYEDKAGRQEREACNVFFVWEMLRPLLRGQILYVIPDDVIYDPPKLLQYIAANCITRMLFTPSLLETVIESESQRVKESFSSLRQIWLCGEVVTTTLLERCQSLLPSVRIINLYSVSECHDVAACDLTEYHSSIVSRQPADRRKFCPVGRLLPGVQVVILDDTKTPQPVGVPGEIYVAGPTLAKGYMKRPELNREKFVSASKACGGQFGNRLYKTGDWGYLLTDSSLEICGRCDTMVKIRGYSVEVQAIEAALLEVSQVNSGVVVVNGQEGEDKFLVAYVVPASKEVTKRQLRSALKRKLPFYMIPSYFVFLPDLPVSAVGKLDKKALPPFSRDREAVDSELLPQTDSEKELAKIWMETLDIKEIDIQESFFDYGGHSLLATKLLNQVNEKFACEVAVKDLFMYPTVQEMAKLIEARKNSGSSPVHEFPRIIDLRSEVVKHDQSQASDLDIQLRAFWRNPRFNKSRWTKGRVLLTGSTGFLGAFILRDLLLYTDTHIFCLVRDSSGAGNKEAIRIKQTLNQFLILNIDEGKRSDKEKELAAAFDARVTAIKSDISLVRFGLSEDDYAFLSSEIDVIIHAAAYVNLIYPYSALYGPNVLGTQNVIVFASNVRVKPIHYISTDAVFPEGLHDVREDADPQVHAAELNDGYSQSKWVAEQLVMKAKQRGMPVIIYRLGNQSGDRSNASWNPADFTLLMLRCMIETRAAPDVNWSLEMTPVDFTSEVIVKMMQHLSQHAGKVLHLVHHAPLKMSLLCDWLGINGYKLKTVEYKEWLKLLDESASRSPAAKSLLRLLEESAPTADSFYRLSTFDNRQLREILPSLNLSYPPLDTSLLSIYFSKLSERGVIPRVRRQTVSGALLGKVAIVTGASSGIGQATAQALAREGCRVALLARRLDILMQVRKGIEAEQGVAAACECDVTSRQQVRAAVSKATELLGPPDILVNCAGVMYYTRVENCIERVPDLTIDINCKGVALTVEAVLQGMIARGGGHIVNLSSDAGRAPFPGLAVYCGTKFFVEGFSRSLRMEVASKNVRVTCIQPGDVQTPLQDINIDPEAFEEFSGAGKVEMLEADDVARAIVYAVKQPKHAAVNEILLQPADSPC